MLHAIYILRKLHFPKTLSFFGRMNLAKEMYTLYFEYRMYWYNTVIYTKHSVHDYLKLARLLVV